MAFFRLSGLIAVGVLACGPSFQAIYECDVRFEHCYALDQRAASPEAKRSCWHQWLRGYTYGQSRDRVEYATSRFSQLSLGPSMSTEESRDVPSARRAPTVATPVPTNAFAPPPNVAASAPAAASSAPAGLSREAALRAPGADCSDGCTHSWSSCREACRARTCDECDRSYRACVPACFHEDAVSPPSPRSAQ